MPKHLTGLIRVGTKEYSPQTVVSRFIRGHFDSNQRNCALERLSLYAPSFGVVAARYAVRHASDYPKSVVQKARKILAANK